MEENDIPILPYTFSECQNDRIPRITQDTILDVLDRKYSRYFDRKMIIDCQFGYKYEGGHMTGAINFNKKQQLASRLFDTPTKERILLIFYCEYSIYRAPAIARYIRSRDRSANGLHYPRLTFPDMYILEGGYSIFFERSIARCEPQAYVKMNSAGHEEARRQGMARFWQSKQDRTKTVV
jgi:M-phase inducer tyrosine phosphatase